MPAIVGEQQRDAPDQLGNVQKPHAWMQACDPGQRLQHAGVRHHSTGRQDSPGHVGVPFISVQSISVYRTPQCLRKY